jgi:hypothetical protein
MPSYLAVVWSFDLQLIAAPPPCAVAAPSVTAEEPHSAGREPEAGDDAAAA